MVIGPFPPRAAFRTLDRVAAVARRFGPVLALLVAPVVSGGCTVLTGAAAPVDSDGPSDDFARSRLIASDFVATMVQIPALSPRRTLLATDAPRNRFGELLLVALQDAGYEVRMIRDLDTGATRLSYTIDPAAVRSANGPDSWTFLVSAGSVRLKRDYVTSADGVRPVSSMYVHGADASRLSSRDALFDAPLGRPAGPGAVMPDRPIAATRIDAPAGERNEPVSPTVERRAETRPTETRPTRAPAATVRAEAAPLAPATGTPNLFETGRSRFAPLLLDYAALESSIMIFPNDSLVMGRENKRAARLIAGRFDPERDVISVVGCSHGPTALQNGNETLANGRSWRVKEEFMLAGIEPDRILEEGCWAGVAHERMPARGVVVTHRRRAG